jgi:hypothetical protein
MRSVVAVALAHQDLPVQFLSGLDSLRSPISQVLFAFHNLPRSTPSFSGLNTEMLDSLPGTPDFDLYLSTSVGAGGLDIALHYDDSLFEAEKIDDRLGRLRVLLEEIAAEPERRISTRPAPVAIPELVRRLQRQIVGDNSMSGLLGARLAAAERSERTEILAQSLEGEIAAMTGPAMGSRLLRQEKWQILGLDSLKIIELASRMEGALGLRIPLSDFSDYPTIQLLAGQLLTHWTVKTLHSPSGVVDESLEVLRI